MDFVAVFRVLTMIGAGLTLGYLVGFLLAYWDKIWPLRKGAVKGVVAPPVEWTFAYHILFALMVLFIFVGSVQRTVQDARPTITTFVMPLLMAAGVVIVRKFYAYYVRTLSANQEPSSEWPL